MNDREHYFTNYLSTHFDANLDFSPQRLAAEYNIFDLNLKKFLHAEKDAPLLEIGFGTGYFLKYLQSQRYTNFSGIELSSEATEFVRKHVTDKVLHVPDTEEFLDNKKGSYDRIIMLDVLEHIPKTNTIRLVQKIRESLTPGGLFMARVPNGSNPLNIQTFVDDFTHEWIFSTASLQQVCRLGGFTDVQVFPFQEETLSWKGQVNNLTQKIIIAILKRLIKSSRVYLNESSFYTKNIFCVCKK